MRHLHEQTRKVSSSGGNRWTHFGARLRPLTSTGTLDHHEAAANSPRSIASRPPASGSNAAFLPQQQQQQQQVNRAPVRASNSVGQPMVGNSLDSSGSDDSDDEDDFDGEALLYKMMQQQNFLMNPSWQGQQQQSIANSNKLSQDVAGQQQSGSTLNGNGQSVGQQQQQRRRADDLSDSRKVIKLLRSYSHIHQVDDSDDQIRGTYTRLSAYRPTAVLPGSNQYSNSR